MDRATRHAAQRARIQQTFAGLRNLNCELEWKLTIPAAAALALTRSRSEMDDLVQATCERALTRVRQWEPETRLDSWMFRIMQNIWFNELRARNVRGRYAEVEQAELISAGNTPAAELHVLLWRVEDEMFRLPEEQRVFLRLAYMKGMTYSEVADAESIPLGTVMSRLARARLTLIQRLEANDSTDRRRD